MTVETKLNPDGSANLIVDGRVAVAGESVQVVDNIAWALRHPGNGGIYDVSEAEEVAEAIVLDAKLAEFAKERGIS